MIFRRLRSSRDERGATLILAIAFMLVVGGVSVATLSYITSGVNQRQVLEIARNREYAADGAIENAIAQVRALPAAAGGPGVAPCGPYFTSLNGFDIRVDCTNAPTLTTGGLLQRNVIFAASCKAPVTPPCTDTGTVVRAQVNFQAVGPGPAFTVTRTWVQSWSVNR